MQVEMAGLVRAGSENKALLGWALMAMLGLGMVGCGSGPEKKATAPKAPVAAPLGVKPDKTVAPSEVIGEEMMKRVLVGGQVVQVKERPKAVAAELKKVVLVSNLKLGRQGRLTSVEDLGADATARAMAYFMLGQTKQEPEKNKQVESLFMKTNYILIQNEEPRCFYLGDKKKTCALAIAIFQDGPLAPKNKQVPVAFKEEADGPWRVAVAPGDDVAARGILARIAKGENLMAPVAKSVVSPPAVAIKGVFIPAPAAKSIAGPPPGAIFNPIGRTPAVVKKK